MVVDIRPASWTKVLKNIFLETAMIILSPLGEKTLAEPNFFIYLGTWLILYHDLTFFSIDAIIEIRWI